MIAVNYRVRKPLYPMTMTNRRKQHRMIPGNASLLVLEGQLNVLGIASMGLHAGPPMGITKFGIKPHRRASKLRCLVSGFSRIARTSCVGAIL